MSLRTQNLKNAFLSTLVSITISTIVFWGVLIAFVHGPAAILGVVYFIYILPCHVLWTIGLLLYAAFTKKVVTVKRTWWMPFVLFFVLTVIWQIEVAIKIGLIRSMPQNRAIVQQPSPTPTPIFAHYSQANTSPKFLFNKWPTFKGKDYTFKYPEGTTLTPQAFSKTNGGIEVRFLGDTQVGNVKSDLKLTDGYLVRVTKLGASSVKTAEQWVTEKSATTQTLCLQDGVMKEITLRGIDSASGFEYSATACPNNFTAIYVTKNNQVYEVVQVYMGDSLALPLYKEITTLMLASMKFL